MVEPVALGIRVPEFDLASQLAKVAQIQHAQTANQLGALQLQEAQGRQSALSQFASNPNDPSSLAALQRYPQDYGAIIKNQEFQQQQKIEQGARAAADYLSAPADQKDTVWKQGLADLKTKGVITDLQHATFSNYPPEARETAARGLIARAKPEEALSRYGVIGSDLGEQQYGWINPVTMQAGAPGAAGTGAAPGSGAALRKTEFGSKDEFLAALKDKYGPGYADKVAAIANYDAAPIPPNSRDPMAKAMALHAQYLSELQGRPFDQTGYAAKQKVVTGMSSGQEAEQIKSLNTVPQHLAGLYEAVTKLNNFSFMPAVTNRIGNAVGGQLSQKTQDAMGEFDSAKKAVAGEMAKVFRAAGMSVAEIDDWKDSFDRSSSPTYMYAAIRKAVELIDGRMGAIVNQWRTTPGLQDKPFDKISKSAQTVFDVLREAHGPLTKQQEAILAKAAEDTRQANAGQPGGRAAPGEKVDHGPLPPPATKGVPIPDHIYDLMDQVDKGATEVTLQSGKKIKAEDFINGLRQKIQSGQWLMPPSKGQQ